MKETIVIDHTSLLSLLTEVAQPGPLRVLLRARQTGEHERTFETVIQYLDWQAQDYNEIHQLLEARTVDWFGRTPFGPHAESVFAAIQEGFQLLLQSLGTLGYVVQTDSAIALPSDLRHNHGAVEIFTWTREPNDPAMKVTVAVNQSAWDALMRRCWREGVPDA